MRPRTRTAISSEEPSPIHFDHSHPWNANDRRGQGLVLELVGFQVTFLRHLLADLLSDSTHLTATDCDLRQLAKHLGRQTKRGMRTTSDHDLPEDRWAEAMPVKSQRRRTAGKKSRRHVGQWHFGSSYCTVAPRTTSSRGSVSTGQTRRHCGHDWVSEFPHLLAQGLLDGSLDDGLSCLEGNRFDGVEVEVQVRSLVAKSAPRLSPSLRPGKESRADLGPGRVSKAL